MTAYQSKYPGPFSHLSGRTGEAVHSLYTLSQIHSLCATQSLRDVLQILHCYNILLILNKHRIWK